ncbi:lyase family protein [Micromonospora sp. NPDC005189]|uniref:lyase family protein n=1 Tax=unclassified Micromonospora TaxID=2617518 RepID=UPI0033A1B969
MTPTTELGQPAPARLDGEHLLPWYIAVEKIRLLEYLRMRQFSKDEATHIGRLLHEAGRAVALQGPGPGSDVASALADYVQDRLAVRWHVGRDRNAVRACAESLFVRDRLARVGDHLVTFGRSAVALARRTTHLPMPGHLVGQPAQVITPGFYFAVVADQALCSGRRLLDTYDLSNTAALGAAQMNDQGLAWDRDRIARLLGCTAPTPHALTAVVSGSWILESSGELATLAVAFSRLVTDLIVWGDADHGYLDLPAEIAGVSPARPLPVLEQIRAWTVRLIALSVDLTLGQHSTVARVPTEPGARLLKLFDLFDGLIRLLTAVLDRLEFRADRMREACDVDRDLHRKLTGGSAHPESVRVLLSRQFVELGEISQAWAGRVRARRAGSAEADRLLGLGLGLGHLTRSR